MMPRFTDQGYSAASETATHSRCRLRGARPSEGAALQEAQAIGKEVN